MCALINIFLIALMVQSGLAIHCFICDSSVNDKCGEDLSDRTLKAQECSYENLGNSENKNDAYPQKSWLLKLSDINYYKLPNAFDIPMACQKIVGVDENEKKTVLRRCQLKNVSSCNFTQSQVSQFNRKITHCSTCDDNGCNGASNNQIFGMMIGVVTTFTICLHFIL